MYNYVQDGGTFQFSIQIHFYILDPYTEIIRMNSFYIKIGQVTTLHTISREIESIEAVAEIFTMHVEEQPDFILVPTIYL